MYKTHHGAEFDHTRLSLSHMRLAETHTALLLYGTQTAQVMPDADGQRPRGTDPATTPRSDTALRQLALKNYALAHRDELTGLSNRRHFMAAVDRLIDGRLPHGLTLGLLDLDDFKLVNDMYGHPVGDALLISLASRLRQHLDPTAQIARLGGDEFAFVYQRGPHADMAQHRCDALCKALNSPHEVNGFTLPVTASIGFAHSPEMAATRTQLLKHADFALYDAKQTRKGTAVAFCASHQKCMQRQTTLQQAFACADLAHELKLEYQPVFDRLSGDLRCFEARASWHSKALGRLPAAAFLPLAEKSGRVSEVSKMLLHKALVAAQHWPDSISLAFTLAGQEISAPHHMERMTRSVTDFGFDLHRLILQIPDSKTVWQTPVALDILQALRARGVRIALDKFGAGQASLSMLATAPLDIVNIDRTLIKTKAGAPPSAVFKMLCDLCQALGLDTLSKGITTEADYRAAEIAGVVAVQGSLFQTPMHSPAMAKT